MNRPRNRPSSNKRGWSALWGRKPRPDSTTPNGNFIGNDHLLSTSYNYYDTGPPTSRGRSAFGLRLPSFKNKNQRRSTVEDEVCYKASGMIILHSLITYVQQLPGPSRASTACSGPGDIRVSNYSYKQLYIQPIMVMYQSYMQLTGSDGLDIISRTI